MDEPVQHPKRKRGTYRKPGHKEVTTRMPNELAAAVREAAAKQGMSVNDYMIALADEAVRDGRDVSAPQVRANVRRTLTAALACLDEEELPVSA